MTAPDNASPLEPSDTLVTCTNCKVQYSTAKSDTPTHTVCPVCSNRQPYGWEKPVAPGPLQATPLATPMRESSEDERQAVFAQLLWFAYNVPHVADPAYPRDIRITGSHTIPFARAAISVLWEQRVTTEATRPYRGEPLPQHPTPYKAVDIWGYKWPLREGACTSPYEEKMDLLDTFARDTCGMCSGKCKVKCVKCIGLGRCACPECHKTRKIKCPECKGGGRITDYNYERYFGTCPDCGGRGSTGFGRYLAGEGIGDGRCKACWGKGQRTVIDKIPFERTCPKCDGSKTVVCGTCSPDGLVACKECGQSGSVKCRRCDGEGQLLHYVEMLRECVPEASRTAVVWPEQEVVDAEIQRELAAVVAPSSGDDVDTQSWPVVFQSSGTAVEYPLWCDNNLANIPLGKVARDAFESTLQKSSDIKRLQKVTLEVRQTIAVRLVYLWNEKQYAHWAIACVPIAISNYTPVSDSVKQLCKESQTLWEQGQKEDAFLKARFCLDIGKKDKRVEDWLTKCGMPDELRAAANSQAWAVFRRATTKRVVAGTAVAVKAVAGWIGGMFRRANPDKASPAACESLEGERIAVENTASSQAEDGKGEQGLPG